MLYGDGECGGNDRMGASGRRAARSVLEGKGGCEEVRSSATPVRRLPWPVALRQAHAGRSQGGRPNRFAVSGSSRRGYAFGTLYKYGSHYHDLSVLIRITARLHENRGVSRLGADRDTQASFSRPTPRVHDGIGVLYIAATALVSPRRQPGTLLQTGGPFR